jgi:PAS domain S-box-containing protein
MPAVKTDKIQAMPFIPERGEMAKLIKVYDWTQTSLGDPDDWPQSLKTTLSILINSKFPTVLFWGKDLICFYNDAFRPSLGIEGKHPWSLGKKGEEMWAEIWPVIKPWLDEVLSGGESIWMENQLVPFYRNGHIEDIYWTFCYNAVYDETNQPTGVFVTCTETTEIVLSENKLRESEKNFRNMVMQAPVGICIVRRPDNQIETVNDLFLELVGRTREETEHQLYWNLLKEAASYYGPILQKVFDTGISFSGTEHKVLLMRNGQQENVYVNFVYEPIKDEKGAIERVMIVAIDVTRQVLSRLEIEKAQLKERLAIDASQLGVFEVDLITDEVDVSPRLNEIFGLENSPARKSYVDIIHPDDMQKRKDAYKAAYQTGKLEYEGRIIRPDGAVRWMRTLGTILFDEEQIPQKLVGVTQDITEQKQFEGELNKKVSERTLALQEKNAELESSNQKLEEFAHAASHDLKEPLRKISFFTGRLKSQLQQRLQEEETQTFSRIEASVKRMVSLVDDLLQYSHLNQMPLEKETVDLNKKLQLVLEDIEIDIKEKQAVIEIEHLPTIKGYRRQLQQLFQNLISNSLKYAKPGIAPHVIIRSEQVHADDYPSIFSEGFNGDYYLIEVSDNGIGFEPSHNEDIFKLFYRLHQKETLSGTGIGLAIAKKVMQNHHGKIVAASKPGEGATFRLFFPVS